LKEDEKQFFLQVVNGCTKPYKDGSRIRPRDIINSEGFTMHYKRSWYLLGKWSDKGWYDYGVTLDLGWITLKGYEVAESLLN